MVPQDSTCIRWFAQMISCVFAVVLMLFLCPRASVTDAQLRYLPENNRYWEWKGLPVYGLYNDNHVTHCDWKSSGSYADKSQWGACMSLRVFGAVFDRYKTVDEILAKGSDESNWKSIRAKAQEAAEYDMLVMIVWHDGGWSPVKQKYGGGNEIVHEYENYEERYQPVLRMAAKYTWDLTNVIHVPIFEVPYYNEMEVFPVKWRLSMTEYGEVQHPGVSGPMFGLMSRANARGFDCLVGEYDDDGPHCDPDKNLSPMVFSQGIPLMRMCSSPYGARNKAGNCPDPVYHYGDPENLRQIEQILAGYMTAESYGGTTGMDVRHWFLQVRCYVENVRSWENEPAKFGGDEITREKLPRYVNSRRPTLTNAPGYTNGVTTGRGGLSFGCVYTDADNDAPVQAEVWVDRNGDGRYDPDPAVGERVSMAPQGSSYANGVTYTVSDVSITGSRDNKVMYIFRFADRNWYPPQRGGVIAGKTPGISYTSWECSVAGVPVISPSSDCHPAPPGVRSASVLLLRSPADAALPAGGRAYDIRGRRIGLSGPNRQNACGVLLLR